MDCGGLMTWTFWTQKTISLSRMEERSIIHGGFGEGFVVCLVDANLYAPSNGVGDPSPL